MKLQGMIEKEGSLPAVRVENLVKVFGAGPHAVRAVDGVSLEVGGGEVFGLLGPNGAGKTTTISILTTLLRPTSGRAEVAGYDVVREPLAVRRRIGLVTQELAVDDTLTGRENLLFHARLHRLPRRLTEERIRDLLRTVELEERADSLVETYSGGMRRRLDLACGLIHRPEVLFLDEPTLGLDVQTRHRMWEYIRGLKEEGVTVFLTTHYMEEADSLCDRLAIVDRGRVMALGTPGELKRRLGPELIRLELQPSDGEKGADLPSPQKILKVEGALSVRQDGEVWTVAASEGTTLLPPLLERLARTGWRVKGLEIKKTTLEDVFLHFTGRSLRAEDGSGERLALSLRRAHRQER